MSNTLKTVNPFTEQTLREYDTFSPTELDNTLENCHQAFLQWREQPLTERAKAVRRVGELLQQEKKTLAQLMTDEMGKLLTDAQDEVDLCSAICEFTAEQGPQVLAEETRTFGEGQTGWISYQPVGVVYGIQPWNFPGYQVVRYAMASLMAGNGVLLKHAEPVTGCALKLESLFRDAGLPEHLFRTLLIDHDQSDKVIKDDRVRGVTLTGSTAAGSKVASLAAEHIKKTVLELGSNDAYLVLEDADMDTVIEHCVTGRIYNNGQTCINAKRFVVVAKRYEEFRDRYVEAMQAIRLGDPNHQDTQLGPMVSKDQRNNVHDQVMKSVQGGATILCGGEIPNETGFFYPATVLDQVAPGQPAYDDELFGPVASLIKAKDEQDALRIANDSRFGLGGGIFSRDVEKAHQLAARYFDTGMIFINGFGLSTPEMPFGGVKQSGYGREHGGFGLREFVNVKSILAMNA